MQKACDWCKKPVNKAGKLFKVEYMMLCKDCRKKYREKSKDHKRVFDRLKSLFKKK